MKVKKRTLLLIACLVWGIAGFNILRIGILAYRPYISVLNVILWEIIPDHGCYDDRRYLPARLRAWTGTFYRRLLFGTGRRSFVGRHFIWKKLLFRKERE